MIVLPETSTRVAPSGIGTSASEPTASIRPLVMSSVACSGGARPVPSITRAPVRTTVGGACASEDCNGKPCENQQPAQGKPPPAPLRHAASCRFLASFSQPYPRTLYVKAPHGSSERVRTQTVATAALCFAATDDSVRSCPGLSGNTRTAQAPVGKDRCTTLHAERCLALVQHCSRAGQRSCVRRPVCIASSSARSPTHLARRCRRISEDATQVSGAAASTPSLLIRRLGVPATSRSRPK